MIRLGSIRAQCDRIAATVRGTQDRFAGALRAVIVLDSRAYGAETNEQVLGHLLRSNPRLSEGLDAVARTGVRASWGEQFPTLETITVAAGKAIATEWAARLRGGGHVANTDATTRAKARKGQSSTPGIATGQLAAALENARVHVE